MKLQKITPLKNFSEFQKEHSLSEEFPFWDFFSDSVALSDGTLVQGLKLEGIATQTWDGWKINNLTLKIRSFLNGLSDNTEISFFTEIHSNHENFLRKHQAVKSSNKKVDEITEDRINLLKKELKEENILKKDIYLFIYKRFESKEMGKDIFHFFRAPEFFKSITREEHKKRYKELLQLSNSISESLEGIGINSKVLNKDETRNIIYKFFNPEREKLNPLPVENNSHREEVFSSKERECIPELSPSSPGEQLIFSDLIVGYKNIFYDEHYHRVLTLKTLPEYTQSSLIEKLMALPFSHSLFLHIKVPKQSKELSILQMRRRMAHSMSISQNGRVSDLESETQVNDTEELLREIIETGQKIFFFELAIKVMDKDRDKLELKSKAVLNGFRLLNGAEGLEENVASFKVFKSLIPFGNINLVRGKRIKANNLADFLPIYESYTGKEQKPICLFRNREKALVKYDPFHHKLPNYNALVTGSSGSGKSFLNNLILLQSMKLNPMTFIIDIGGSYKKLSSLMNGEYIEIAPPSSHEENSTAINPFLLEKKETLPSPRKIKFLLALLETIFTEEEGDKLPKLEKALLEEKISELYKTNKNPMFSNFKEILKNSKNESLERFSQMLYPWTGDRPYGRLLDKNKSFNIKSDFVVFDLKGLSNYPDLQAVMILIITDFILERIESDDPKIQCKKKRILMDECWELLKNKSSSHFMEYCVRTLRKTGSGITFITQGMEEIVNHPIGAAILGNTATKFILEQKGDLKPLENILKLDEKEVSLISSLKSKKREFSEAFMISNEDKAVVRLYPSKKEYWIATSDFEDNAKKIKDK